MNEAHLRICSSPEWASYVAGELLPWVLASHELGDEVLELGPGPGLTTDVLRQLVPRLTAVEIDQSLAAHFGQRAPMRTTGRSRPLNERRKQLAIRPSS